jgi:hypothetical protein
LKRIFVCSLVVILPFLTARAFPTEEQVRSQLRVGMTPQEAAAVFGNPNSGVAETCSNCTFRYVAPLGTRTVEREGYIGFVIEFRDGKATKWRIMTGYPSYEPPKMPRDVKIWLWLFPVLLGLGIVSKLILRATPVAYAVADEIAKTFEAREIQTRELPSEFRFITHETTLQEVLDRLGKPSREVKVPINAEAGLGYALVSSGTGPAVIQTFEYELPYRAAVIVMPEFPFARENRIRAVFYRPIQRDLEDE